MTKAKWYVYELVDPRYGEAFYVGKGCGDRIAAHEKEAKSKPMVCTEKMLRIRDIWDSGFEVERRHVAFFWDEQHAYDYESQRVESYGLEALTNILPGGGGLRGSFISRPARELTPDEYARLLVKSANGFAWFAIWLRGEPASCYGGKYHEMVIRAATSVFFPKIWERIKSSAGAVEIVRPHLLRYGVEVVYGCA